MTRLRGKVISRPLTVVPQEGAQVMRYRFGGTHPGNQILDTVTAVFGNRIEFKSGGYQSGIERLYELCVQYKLCRVPNTIYETTIIPLKYSQWQAAIDNGEVDSAKEVEFEIINTADKWDRLRQFAEAGKIGDNAVIRQYKQIAKIIPAKPVAEDWYPVINRYCEEDGDSSATHFFNWLRKNFNPPTKIKQ